MRVAQAVLTYGLNIHKVAGVMVIYITVRIFIFLNVGDLVWLVLSKVVRVFPYSGIRRDHYIFIHNQGNLAICTVPKTVQLRIAIGRCGVKRDRRSYRGREPGAAGGEGGNP